ncbi:MAG TPA: hypothetical protein PLH70_04145 [Bacteroidales bacterium]|nr:hypothetical protein [Bacteroidales bacterium]HOH22442.1 hypothetical protein [Bacteroidales bacterium]HPZ03567.1 hypothetical protein [Bacteroidales bacterium]HQB74975.1 hypothetical protein [Bacteroidales bacterium]
MNKKNNIDPEDELIRQLMRSAKEQAPENLKYRIMQQINTENALTPKPAPIKKRTENVLRDFIGIFGTMYALLALLTGIAYLSKDENFLLSPEFIGVVLLVTVVASTFWFFTRLDEKIRQKQK